MTELEELCLHGVWWKNAPWGALPDLFRKSAVAIMYWKHTEFPKEEEMGIAYYSPMHFSIYMEHVV